MVSPAVLLLADSRLPSGGHAHSGGIEMAVADGMVSDVDDLELFLRGRLRTVGPVHAGFAAAGCRLADGGADWARWDRAYSARVLSAALRAASRAQGAALLRTASRIWDHPALAELRGQRLRPHQPLVLGAAVAAGRGTPADAAALAVHHLVGGACSAAIRLLGLDPLAVAAVQGGLSDAANHAATTGLTATEPPATGAVLPELLAARHAQSEVTLFAS
ncbi:MAG TPA: urease accessory UreF family protein [Pseudonocardiaceae bacterium]